MSALQALPTDQPRPSPTVFGVAACLLARWRLVLLVPLVLAAAAAAVSFLLPIRFSATAMFYPETRASSTLPANLAGIASQFGLTVSAQSQQGTDFYVQILSSRQLLTRLLQTRFLAGAGPNDSLELLAQLKVRGRSPAELLENGVALMRKRLNVSIERRTGVASVTVDMPRPDLAAAVANEILHLLDDYNLETRQSEARERRQFVEGRVTSVTAALTSVEDSLRRFYDANREWQSAPRLRFEEGRLNRRVQVQQAVLISLMQDLESAKIAEVNDAPVITVVDPAVPPTRKSSPQRKLLVLGVWLLTFLIVSVFVLLGAYRGYFVEGDPVGTGALQAQWRRLATSWRSRRRSV
jgi:uncharacterized protein involved in exopolysaccharide biosynthesis